MNKFNSEITENAVVTKLNEELQEKQKAISAMLDAIEKGVFTNSTKDRLLKLENDKALLEEKIAIEQAHSLKPLEKKTIVNFLKIYANKKFESTRDKNDFFNNFILRVNLYDDRITIVYNTSLNPATEIYKTDNEPDNDPNGGGITIYSKTIEKSEIGSNLDCRTGLNASSCNQNLLNTTNNDNLNIKNSQNNLEIESLENTQQKSRLNHLGFKRQLFGGKIALQS